jgi:hypothetical protein
MLYHRAAAGLHEVLARTQVRILSMQLPNDYPFAKMPLQQFPEPEMHRFDCCRAGAADYFIGTEDPLCPSQPTEHEAYQFFWKSSFDGMAPDHYAGLGFRKIGARSEGA